MPADPAVLLAWLSAAAVPDGLRVGGWMVVTDGGLWKEYYTWALQYAEGQHLRGAVANVRVVRAAMEDRP